jgi:NAD-dependent dihydropyrimidine dehydrogenase PreA subunit
MGLFIEIIIDQSKFIDLSMQKYLARVCPVDALIFSESGLYVDEEKEDECTLCNLCIQNAPPGAIKIVKTYQPWLVSGV